MTPRTLVLLYLHHIQYNYPHLIEQVERAAHEQHVNHVRGRGEQGCHDADGKDRVAPVPFKGLPCDETYLGCEDHEDGQLENETEGQDEDRHKIDKFVDRDNRFKLLGLEAEQEFDAVSEAYGIAKPGTQVK